MDVCGTAWNVFTREIGRAENNEGYNEPILSSAVNHIEDCPSCMARWEALKESTSPSPSPKLAIRESFLYLAAKATGLPPEEISNRTPLGPLQIANLLILLGRGDRLRRVKSCFTDRMTVGRLIALWEGGEITPERKPPALADLAAPAK